MTFRAQLVAVAGAVALLAVGTSTTASSAPDVTPPTLNAPVKASFTVGGQLSAGTHPDCYSDPNEVWAYLPATFKWTGSDASGYVRYSLVQNTGAVGPEDVFTNSTQTSYSGGYSDNSSQDCGGGNWTVYQWDLSASDAAGNTTTKQVYGGRMRLTQDNSLADHDNYAPAAVVSYAGSWQLASCACWSQQGVHKTTAAGASATIGFNDSGPFTTTAPTYPMHVGLIMHTGPDRGKFKVYVAGVLKATVDTYAASSKPRVMVWQTSLAQKSTIKVVNVGTAGRARIDLDAVVTN
jgi:hypothetical protein